MKKITFIVEKTETGYSAYVEDFDKYPVGMAADNMAELKTNILDALNSYYEIQGVNKEATGGDVSVQPDLP